MGTIAGVMLSLLSLILTSAGHLIIMGRPGLPPAVIAAGLTGGLIAGASAVALSSLCTGRERAILVILISTAVASLAVYVGGYSNRSLVPPAIYGLALLNGLLIAKVTARFCARRIETRRTTYL
jgi:hypothetical protein